MRSLALALALALAATTALVPDTAAARRLGGGGAVGMQRTLPPRAPTTAPPVQPAAPAAAQQVPSTPGAAAAAAPRRSWLGPVAGIAAGLGIAALMSHLGLGAAFGEFVTLLLLALVVVVAIRFFMRRLALQPAGAGAQFGGAAAPRSEPTAFAASSASATDASARAALPPLRDFDAAGFERVAKMILIRLQAANDAGDLNDLRLFTTPEMFAAIRLELQERRAEQRTDVVRVDAEVLDLASEPDRQLVSVRFHGLIREESASGAMPFDEVWHLVRPADGSREWAIAGIQPTTPALAS
ncbi:MAG: Tim44 domain-containing protein [Rhizobacter sp.]|nr:Tim44 domain-containing protein [Rhizobacter sp.]